MKITNKPLLRCLSKLDDLLKNQMLAMNQDDHNNELLQLHNLFSFFGNAGELK